MNDFLLPISDEAKFLGLTFDRKLTWKLYILGLKKKYLQSLNILKIVNNKNQGPSSKKTTKHLQDINSPEDRLRLYNILIRIQPTPSNIRYSTEYQPTVRSQSLPHNTCSQLTLSCWHNYWNIKSDSLTRPHTNIHTFYTKSDLWTPKSHLLYTCMNRLFNLLLSLLLL